MKKTLFFPLVFILFFGCSKSDNSPEEPKNPPAVEKPVAVNDVATGVEDNDLSISGLLSNDTVTTGSRITAFSATSANGATIVDERNGSYTYEPQKGFVGTDTFTYTLCDRESTPNCSTATVTITITDEGTPAAIDDTAFTVENTSISISKILDNDTLTDDAEITSVDSSNASGDAVLEDDGTITYTPANDFLGDDSFTYTICDDDTPNATCVSATVTVTVLDKINFNIPTELAAYYDGVAFSDNQDLMFTALENLTKSKHTTILSYGQRHNYLYSADEDETNADNVILMYSGESRYWEEYTSGTNSYSPQTFNTEHVFPQSRLSTEDAVTDLHHLRACDSDVNESRSNFGFIDGTGEYKLEGNKWYPGDDWRGDVARMILYLNVRYGEDYTKMASIDLFLAWNIADPVSSFEAQRNNIIEGAQGNRNPFIDNPYLITLIWGGDNAENKWN